MKKFVLSVLCGAVMGCADGSSTTSDIDSDDPVRCTIEHPRFDTNGKVDGVTSTLPETSAKTAVSRNWRFA